MSKKHIVTGGILLGVSSLLSRLLGVVRDHLFAVRFGAGDMVEIFDLDTYFAAFRIPDLLYNLLILGTISAAFVPIFTGYIVEKRRREGFEFVNSVLHLILFLMFVISLIVFLTAPWLVKALVPGFSPEKLAVTINLTRFMLLSPLFFSLSSIAQSVQNTFKTFVAYSLAPIVYNLSIIFGAVFLSERFGVYGLAIGVVFGAALHFCVQIPALVRRGYRYRFLFDWKREDVREMFRLMGPRIIGVSAMQFLLLVDTFLASLLAVGSIAVFNFAVNLNWLPIGVVGISLAIASFSTLSELAKHGSREDFSRELSRIVQWILLLIIPATFGMFLLRHEITTLILQGGKFDSEDVILTASALGFLVLSLIAQSLIPLFSRAFYAWHDTKTPVKIVLFTVFVHAIVSVLLALKLGMGVRGLALAYTISQFLNFALLLYFLGKMLGGVRKVIGFQTFGKFIGASVIMAFVLYFGKRIFGMYLDDIQTFWMRFFEVVALIGLSMIVYAAILWRDIRKGFL